MSLQTKEQSIGYILKGVLDSGLPANYLVDVARKAKNVVPESNRITNEDTLDFAEKIGEFLEFSPEQVRELRGEIYYAFDMKTVEEAGDIFEAFSMLFPVLKN